MVILYLGDYYLSEEHFLQDNNVPCVRLDYPFSHNGNIGVQSGDTVLIRGGKLNTSAYADVAHYFEQHALTALSAHMTMRKSQAPSSIQSASGSMLPRC